MTEDKIKQIKQSFRLLMNGETSRYMRDNGVNYHLNWGVSFTDLKKMAEEYGKDFHLAVGLWKENIRECKILATLIMPAEEMPAELADLWMEQADTQELVELLALNLFQYLDYAPVLAFEWISSPKPLYQIGGYHVLSGCMLKGDVPDDRGINEIIDQALTALQDESVGVRHAAYNCLMKLAQLGEVYEHIVSKALDSQKR